MLTLNMRSHNAISFGLCLANVLARSRSRSDYYESNDVSLHSEFDLNIENKAISNEKRHHVDFVTPFINSGLPVALFSSARASKFTELTYRTIKNLVLPRLDFLGPMAYGWKREHNKHNNIESEIYILLLHVINTINPIAFDAYYDAFYCGRYYECFLILQRLYCCDSELERLILANVLLPNRRIPRENLNGICFVDVCTKEVFCIELPSFRCDKRVCLQLPRQVLKFEELVLFSFDLDEAILADLEYFCPLGLRHIYCALVKRFHKTFDKLTNEQRILFFLRIKFFVFNSVGLTISFLNTGVKQQILDLMIRTAKTENDAFFRAYAVALGLLNK